jgi:hypothetical protein
LFGFDQKPRAIGDPWVCFHGCVASQFSVLSSRFSVFVDEWLTADR